MPSRKNQSQSSPGRRDEILRVLKGSSHPLSIADIADQLGVHPNTVRFHLDRLVANGQVERVSPQQRVPGRPPQLFRAVAGMDPAGPRQYRMLAEILAGTLNTADSEQRNRAVEAGRRWGHQHCASPDTGSGAPDDPIDKLVALLDEVGFAPEREAEQQQPAGGTARINLRNCPFLELAQDRPQITCPIHLGLMRGAMEAWGSPITVDRLDAFVEPGKCVVQLTTAKAG